MILCATLSKPRKNTEALLGKRYERIKIRMHPSSSDKQYVVEKFTSTQAFHEHITAAELDAFLNAHAGKTFKNCTMRTESETITVLANKKGKITTLKKTLANKLTHDNTCLARVSQHLKRTKNYLLPEGTPVPFLVMLGVMTTEGKVIAAKYDKFRQINRFLEFIDDIVPHVQHICGSERPLRIIDFGCGKSYLTFAVQYYFSHVKKIDAHITGLDIKEDVVAYCNTIAAELHCSNLSFCVGTIARHVPSAQPDIVIALHACDTATDEALAFAVKHNCAAILSVPCCQHEINKQLEAKKAAQQFAPLLKYGIIKERFAALVTDALRAEYLGKSGYSVQLLEFIAMEHTPKNILIRAVKKNGNAQKNTAHDADALTDALHVSPSLHALLQD
ncbi:MAG: SAM-dependent methyltransferase [Treponema sp.]|nr:SAM-dependent methyltransferase [Treponema sp.]